jgi:hypothetical protein
MHVAASWYKYEGLRMAKGQALLDWVTDNPNLQASACHTNQHALPSGLNPLNLHCARNAGSHADGGHLAPGRAAARHAAARGPL